MNKDNPQVMEPYKINITTGVFEKCMQYRSKPYHFDKDGFKRFCETIK
jgi:hypothetical protein